MKKETKKKITNIINILIAIILIAGITVPIILSLISF